MPDLKIANGGRSALLASIAACLVALVNMPAARAADVNVTVTTATAEGQPNAFTGGLRWTLEEDVTHDVDPTAPPGDPLDSPTLQFHKSYMPLAKTGSSASPSFTVTGLDASKRYYLSVLPDRPAGSACTTTGDKCYSMSGAPVRFATPASTNTSTLVTLTAQPLPPSQARVFAFDDTAPINNAWDTGEAGLGGFTVFIYDMGGPLTTDVFGNPLGTEYVSGTLDGDASPTITRLGDGTIHTITAAEVNDPVRNPHALKVGEALIQNLAPGKYGIQIVPPEGAGWHQTTTIEGTKGIDVWLRAGEPMFAVEFGPTFAHAFYGFVKEFDDLGASPTPGKVQGQVVNLRMSRPPNLTETLGQPLPLCYIGLNEMASATGLYVGRCNEDSTFEISGVPPGTYQLVVWDEYLDVIISFFTVVVGPGETVLAGDNGKVGVPRWFGQQEHYVFNDLNGNGIWDQPAEKGIPDQTINFRYRDGSIYQSSTTDTTGFLPFDEIFPFFSWLIAEVDFARFKATGATIAVDDGGPVVDGPVGRGKLNPQIQDPLDGGTNCGGGGCETRTELSAPAPVLLEGFNLFSGNTNIFEWGKKAYDSGENGGITGVVYTQTTRAENDPRFAAAETWEPGIPRVQLNLYRSDATGVIQDNNGTPGIQLADVDNYPFGFQDGAVPGPEDNDRNSNNAFDLGDALEAGHTDSWDDNLPTGCIGDTLVTDGRCYDGLRNFSQVRPAVFDGGYAFGVPFTDLPLAPGPYVVEAVPPPGYRVQDEASKNVDFGDTFVPHALPPVCVGDPAHTDGNQQANHYDPGAELSLFPGVEMDPAYLGDRPVCNFKQIMVTDGKNAAADFFLYTDVPVTGHIQGLTTNDIGNDTNPNSPNFGEKLSPSNVPVSIRDHAGNELNRVYTDAYGHYEGLVPSTYRISVPMPSGVSPGVVQVCINPPTKPDPAHLGMQIPDPYFDPRYSQACYSLNFTPGQTTYLDTPIIPVAAFVGTPDWQLDCNYPDGTPIIRTASVGANGKGGGPYIAPGGSRVLTLAAVGALVVPDPANPRPATVTRDFGFGDTAGKIFLNGSEIPSGNITWGATTITVNVPAGAPFNITGQLEVLRANGLRSVHGITLIQGVAAANVTSVSAGQSIQAAIDATPAGGAVLVGPGLYYESLFMTKPIQLQGWGAAGTVINAGRSVNYANLLNWRDEAQRRTNCPSTPVADRIGLLPGQSNNTGGEDPCLYEPGTGLFPTEEAAGVLVAPRPNVFGTTPARIDGLTITSADFSGGIIVNGYATNLEISNNVLVNNQGQDASGIRIGHSSLVTDINADAGGNGPVVDAQNRNIRIHHNNVTQNGSLEFAHGGGIGLFTGSDNYRVSSNYVCGNFTQGDGAGIGHFGRSPGGVIENNQVLFNQSFDQTAQLTGGSAGGILIAGHPQPVGAAIAQSAGSGSVQIVNNRIQGNQAGSGDGGGIALRSINGQDVLASLNDASWNRIEILNNLIVNNVAALAGGGIVLQDALRVSIINNTIVNNDSTATAAAAFVTDPNVSEPQPAGVVARLHSLDLQALPALLVGTFSNPTLENNIILGNRMQHWESASGLVVDGVQDLAVLGTAGALNAQFNVLTDDAVNAGYNANNPRVAVANEDALLAAPYFNGQSGIANANFGTPLLAASATDEGGNFLSVVFGPLSKTGDYHLQTNPLDPVATDKAIDRGTNASLSGKPALLRDMDGESRPVDGTAGNGITIVADIGADEAPVVALATAAPPQILSTQPSLIGFTGVPYVYQVVAVDPNGTAVGYTITSCTRNIIQACGSAPTINSTTGLLTWTPSLTGAFLISIRAFSPTNVAGNRADQVMAVAVTSPAGPPVANPDSFNVSSNGLFSVPAPGVIGNDAASPLYGAMTAELVSNLTAGGSVTLAPDGSFNYLPDAGFVGAPTFQYRVSATRLLGGSIATSANAAVTLNRELATTSMKYGPAAGEWHFAGNGSVNGRTLTFKLDRTGGTIGTTGVAGGAWAFATTTGPSFQAGDTVTITATGGVPPAFTLGAVPVIAASATSPAVSTEFVQCPGDTDGDAIIDAPDPAHPNAVCRHLAAGDGFIKMADTAGTELYTFGFNDVTGQPRGHAIEKGLLNAHFPAPTLAFDEGDEVYLTLTNVGTLMRPDLFDPHSVHFHGFPNAGSVFDGVPESSITINQGFSFTYYYNIVEVGTFMYHCHVEAPEHMQMGMLGNLYVRPAQNGTSLGGFNKFVYNDGDGSTGYDVEVPIQIGSMDSTFHIEHLGVQPLPFANMHDDFPMLNGRGYPDTVNPLPLDPAQQKVDVGVQSSNESSQVVHTRIEANAGQRVLLRISNLNVTRFYTLATTGLPMRVIGTGAHILRGPGGASLYYDTSSVTLGGGESADVLVDTTGIAPGTYLLYSTNLEALSNGTEDFGGMMTEIVIH